MGSGKKTFKWIAVFAGYVLPFCGLVNAADGVTENLRTGRSRISQLGDSVSEASLAPEQSDEPGRVRIHDSGVNGVVPVSHSCACPPGRVRIHILDSNGCRDNRFDLNGNYTPYSFSTNSAGDAGANRLGGGVTGSGSADAGFFAGLGAAVSVARTAKHRSPNVKGDLLGSSRGVSFFYHRVGSTFADVEGGGFIGFKNAKVAENNSPEPRDRVAFRYNYFHNAQNVGGYTAENPINIMQGTADVFVGIPFEPVPFPFARLIDDFDFQPLTQFRTVERSYDEHLFTFSVEQTFAEESFSLELRVPMRYGLASDQNLSSGDFIQAGEFLDITPTPSRTLGEEATEIGNMNLITKSVLYDDPSFLLSGGFGMSIPTGDDAMIQVTDFTGLTYPSIEGTPIFFRPAPADAVRIRTFEIDNDAWSISPYLSFLTEPNERFYVQGFGQLEIALNPNHYQFSNIHNTASSIIPSLPNTLASGSIHEQSLLHLNLAAGYWFYRNPSAARLNGIAGQIELHYTTTLNDADIVTLPGEGAGFIRQTASQGGFVPEPEPTIGNAANRLDILNLTVGTTLEIFNHVTLAAASVVPLRDGHDKFFDWELNFQLNYYLDPIHPR